MIRSFTYLVIISLVSSCSKNHLQETELVENFIGQSITLPDGKKCQILEDPFVYEPDYSDYKVITFIDSTGCTSCNMKLALWKDAVDEFKGIDDVDVDFLMIIASKNRDEVTRLLKTSDFRHPVLIDSINEFTNLNFIPDKQEHRTFLLDAENKIVAIGNPAINPKIKDLYLRIMEDGHIQKEPHNDLLVKKGATNLGLLNKGDIVKTTLTLQNTDTFPYHVIQIVPSCDCMIINSEIERIKPSEISKITIEFQTDSISGSMKKYVDIFLEEKEEPERITLYGYIKQ